MKILLLLTAILLLGQITCAAQPPVPERPPAPQHLRARVKELHLYNPLYRSVPVRGEFTGTRGNRLLYRTAARQKKLHGEWVSWYANMLQCDSGRFVKGLPEGTWKRWDQEGRLRSIRTFDADRYLRIVSEMMHANPKAVLFPLTRLYRRDPAAALHYLHADYSFPGVSGGRQLSLETHVIQNTSGDSIYHPVFDRGLHHGLYMNFDTQGNAIDSGYYANGLRQGYWIHRWPDHRMEEGAYSNGKPVKEWKLYSETGKLLRLRIYDREGKLGWEKNYNQ